MGIMLLILWTTPTEEEAMTLLQGLLERHWIACGTMLPGARSLYVWQGKIEKAQEVQCLLKTHIGYQERILDYLRQHGSYANPEFLCFTSDWGSHAYEAWAAEHLALGVSAEADE